MTVLRVLSLVLGTLIVLAILGSALKTVVLPQEGFPRLAQAVFALVHRLLVHRWRTMARATALRGIYAPVALVSLPLVWMLMMVVAFSFVFWGTGGLNWQKAFEISGSSLTTLGFQQARRDRPHLARLHRGDDRVGPGRAPHQLPAHHLLRLQRPREGHQPAPADRRRTPRARPDLLQTLHRIGVPRRPGVLEPTRPTGCSTWSRRTRPSRSSPTSPRPTRPLLGRHRRLAARRRRARGLGIGRPRRTRSSRTSRRGP